jgi:hypothetical protein
LKIFERTLPPDVSYVVGNRHACSLQKWEDGMMRGQLIPEGVIERRIFIVRGHKVMLDRDLAELYEVETRVLNQAVRRNKDRFPDDFMFSLTREEIMNLSQIVISSKIKHAPNVFVFTEQGVSMLSTVLNSKRAVHVNIEIMRAFVRLNKMIRSHRELLSKIREMEKKYDTQFKVVFDAIKQLMAPLLPKANRIITGFRPDKQ